jgi:hypothetical protein
MVVFPLTKSLRFWWVWESSRTMPLPECGVLWPTSREDKGIDAVRKAAIDASVVDLTEVDREEVARRVETIHYPKSPGFLGPALCPVP